MALSGHMTLALAGVLKPGMRVASMGYPDLIAPMDMVEKMIFPSGVAVINGRWNAETKEFEAPIRALKYREDSAAICKRHGLQERQIPDAESFFSLLGCKLDVYDIVQERGCEILCDLNEPILARGFKEPKIERYSYDVVLDVGTAEHCANIFQAFSNMVSMLKIGGFILHENPHSGWHNHGFYSIHPTFYNAFYTSNGFEVLKCVAVTRDGQQVEVPATARFTIHGDADLNMLCVAKRTQVVPFVFPVQTKYAKLIPAAGVQGEKLIEVENA